MASEDSTPRQQMSHAGLIRWLEAHPWAEAAAAGAYGFALAQIQIHAAAAVFGWRVDLATIDGLVLGLLGVLYVRSRRRWHELAVRSTTAVASVAGLAAAGFAVAHLVSLILADVDAGATSFSPTALVLALGLTGFFSFGLGFGGVHLLVWRAGCTIGTILHTEGGTETRWLRQH